METIKDSKMRQWFEVMDLAEKTRENYEMYLKVFCECVGKTPDELISEAIEETKAGKLISERTIVPYLAKFKTCLKQKAFAPTTQTLAFAAVRSFYRFYDIQLPSAVSKSKRTLPLRENRNFLSKEDVVKLVINAKSLRDKAIVLCMATSGMARREILNLRLKDITFTDTVGVVDIRRQKTDVDYTTFISDEAVIALKNYLGERERTDKLRTKGNKDFVFVDYHNGARLDKAAFSHIFKQLATQLGYTNGEFQIKSKSHALRKFFASTLENAGMPKNKIDFMLGHTRSGNDLAYFDTNIETLKKLYIRFLPYLTFETNIVVRSLDTEDAKRLEELEKENERLKVKLESKDSETQDLKKRLDKLESAMQAIISAAGKK